MNQSIKAYNELREDYLDLFRQIASWLDDTFGERRDLEDIHTKLVHEVNELGKDIAGFKYKDYSAGEVNNEIVDVMIVLIDLYSRVNKDMDDLYTNILHKFEVLQQRRWKKMGDGTFQHQEGFTYNLNFTKAITKTGIGAHDQDQVIWYVDLLFPNNTGWDFSTVKEHMEQLKPEFKWEVDWLVGNRFRLKILDKLKQPVIVEATFPFPLAMEPGVIEKA